MLCLLSEALILILHLYFIHNNSNEKEIDCCFSRISRVMLALSQKKKAITLWQVIFIKIPRQLQIHVNLTERNCHNFISMLLYDQPMEKLRDMSLTSHILPKLFLLLLLLFLFLFSFCCCCWQRRDNYIFCCIFLYMVCTY